MERALLPGQSDLPCRRSGRSFSGCGGGSSRSFCCQKPGRIGQRIRVVLEEEGICESRRISKSQGLTSYKILTGGRRQAGLRSIIMKQPKNFAKMSSSRETIPSSSAKATGSLPITPAKSIRGGKKPSDPREYPLARDARGSASRQEIRRMAPSVNAPRQSRRPTERSNQSRSHRSGSERT